MKIGILIIGLTKVARGEYVPSTFSRLGALNGMGSECNHKQQDFDMISLFSSCMFKHGHILIRVLLHQLFIQ